MAGTIFWDVDTQVDFIMPDGKLYVNGAERILPNLAQLTDYARHEGIPILGSVDHHSETDAEISESPDFEKTFPPHCLSGTHGQEKVPETSPLAPLWIDPQSEEQAELKKRVKEHQGEVIFRKRRFDVFTNANVECVIEEIYPDRIILYGVALDVCNAYAIEGFLKRRVAPITLVLDATQAIIPERGEELVKGWKSRGVKVASTEDIIGSREL